MKRALLVLSLLSGCAVDPCSDKPGTCIALEIRAGAGVPSTVRQIGVRMLTGFDFSDAIGERRRPEVEKPTSLPAFVALLPPPQFPGGDYSLEVNAYVNGERVGTATAEAAIDLKAKKRLTVTLLGAGTPDDGGAGGDDGPPGVCEPVKQTGCSPGDKCTADINGGALSCVGDRTANIGDECAQALLDPVPATDPCKKGLWCVPDLQLGLFFSCRQFCSVDADCTQGAVVDVDNKGRCQLKVTSANKFKFCTQACDPTISAPGAGTCTNGTACRVTVNGTIEYTNCESDRGGEDEGMPCGGGCNDGLTCFKGICRKPCLIKAPVCFSGTCTPPFSGAKPYGFCCPGGSC